MCHDTRSRTVEPMASAAASRAASSQGGRRAHDYKQQACWLVSHRALILAAIALLALAAGGLLHLAGVGAAGDRVWQAAIVLLAAELTVEVAHTVLVERHMGVDTIALVAMVGSLALGEDLAGVVVGLMFSGGAALEDVASARARLAASRYR
jgi:cation transport ATPase